jgi:hypothetical protein
MPTIRKATRGAEFLHGYGTVRGGDTVEVDADTAAYLVEQDDYERVVDVDGEEVTSADDPTVAEQIDNGVCPWCDDYEGDGVPQHASSAHSQEWAAYSEGDG